MLPGLAALIHPHPVAELHAGYLADEPFVVHAAAGVAELFELPLLASLDALLTSWPDQVQVYEPEVDDEAASTMASPHEARTRFASGLSLMFNEVHQHVPRLVAWLDGIRAELGLSVLTQQRCLAYATPAGKGTAPHFDQNVNFVVQVHGTKTWRLAPNTHVTRPMTRHTIGLEVDPELSTYATLPMPAAMPKDPLEIVLEPGSVLFVPRGMWHATHATSEALALNFTFSPPTWIDVVMAALRGRLACSPAWRETAAPASAATLEALLRELADDAPHWSAAEILAVTEGEHGDFLRRR